MLKMLCVYFFLYIQSTKSDSLPQTRNCSNELEPLLNGPCFMVITYHWGK